MPRCDADAGQIDLFGFIVEAPANAAVRLVASRARGKIKADRREFRDMAETAFDDLASGLEDAIQDLRVALSEYDTGEVDCALEALDQAVSQAMEDARRELRCW